MDENTSASTESAAPVDSGASQASTATSASSTGVSEQVTAPAQTTDTATAESTSDDQIDIGWKFDGEVEGEAVEASEGEEPDENEDLVDLAKDPALDPQKTPGLVEAIKKARADQKDARQQIQSIRQEIEANNQRFEKFGGPEGALAFLEPLAPFMEGAEGSANGLLHAIYKSSAPAYENLVEEVYKSEQKWLVEQMQKDGLIPDGTATKSQPSSSNVSAEILETIPESLRDTALRLAKENPEYFEDLILQPDGVRDHNLKREKDLNAMSETQAKQERDAYETRVKEAQTSGRKMMEDLSNTYEQGHYKELAKWKPFGDNSAANTRLYREVVEGAFSDILADSKFSQMYEDAHGLLQEAPMLRLQQQEFKAASNERQARAMALQFNRRLGQLIGERVKERASVYSDAHKWRELQRQKDPRTEVSGKGQPLTGSNHQPTKSKSLTADGRISQDYVSELIERHNLKKV